MGNSRAAAKANAESNDVPNVDKIYIEMLSKFYEEQDRAAAKLLAKRLLDLMDRDPELRDSIRAEEVRSIEAELRGDLAHAIECREAEIRKIYLLHSLALRTPQWPSVEKVYDYSDLSDRLDLLALLYDELGNLDRAIEVLQESKRYCEAAGIAFDGQDIFDELSAAKRDLDARGTKVPDVESLDAAIIETYRKFRIPADRIASDQYLAREFYLMLLRRTRRKFAVSQAEVGKRLQQLKRKGPRRNGLPPLVA